MDEELELDSDDPNYHDHDCWDDAQPYEFEEHGRRYHGWECGICGKFLQSG